MGIKDLGKLLPKEKKELYEYCYSYEAFKGKAIAIDMSIIMYKNSYGGALKSYREAGSLEYDDEKSKIKYESFNLTINFLTEFLINGITPVCVFDGERIPEKHQTIEERLEERERVIKKAKELKERIDNGECSKEILDEYRRKKSSTAINAEDNEDLKMLLEQIGFICLTATYEAEKLCVMLEKEGYVSAVYSTDQDCLAMGCNTLIVERKVVNKQGKKEYYFRAKIGREIKAMLGLNHTRFLHLCVLCGTDFNYNIPGMGPKKSIKYIYEHGYIKENVLYNIYGNKANDFINKYKKTIEIFKDENVEDICMTKVEYPFKLEIKLELLDDILSYHNLESSTNRIVEAYEEYNKLIS